MRGREGGKEARGTLALVSERGTLALVNFSRRVGCVGGRCMCVCWCVLCVCVGGSCKCI